MGYLQGMAAALLVMSLAGCQPDGVRPDGTAMASTTACGTL